MLDEQMLEAGNKILNKMLMERIKKDFQQRTAAVKKEKQLEVFENGWKERIGKLKESGMENQVIMYAYKQDRERAIQNMIIPFGQEVSAAFLTVSSRRFSSKAEEREKAFFEVIKKELSEINAFAEKLKETDSRLFGSEPSFSREQRQMDISARRALGDKLFQIAREYDRSPDRKAITDLSTYANVIFAGFMEQEGKLDAYKDTGSAVVLVKEAEKYQKEPEGMSHYFVAAQMEDIRKGRETEIRDTKEYILDKLEEATGHVLESLDNKRNHDDVWFCRKVADMMSYSEEVFDRTCSDTHSGRKGEDILPPQVEPILKPPIEAVLKAAKARDEKLVQNPVLAGKHPEAAGRARRRLESSPVPIHPLYEADPEKKEMIEKRNELIQYGKRVTENAIGYVQKLVKTGREKGLDEEKINNAEKYLKKLEGFLERFQKGLKREDAKEVYRSILRAEKARTPRISRPGNGRTPER